MASVGNTVLDVLEDGVGAGVAAKGELLHNGLLELQDRHAVVGDVRGRGLMQGLEIVLDRETKQSSPELGAAVTARCLELGLHMNIVNLPALSGTFRIAPALTTTDEQLRLGRRDPRPGDHGRRAPLRLGEHVPEDVDHLLGLARHGQRGAVDLLEGVVVLGRVQRDQRLAERRGVAGVERGVPLPVLLSEPHHDDVGLARSASASGWR